MKKNFEKNDEESSKPVVPAESENESEDKKSEPDPYNFFRLSTDPSPDSNNDDDMRRKRPFKFPFWGMLIAVLAVLAFVNMFIMQKPTDSMIDFSVFRQLIEGGKIVEVELGETVFTGYGPEEFNLSEQNQVQNTGDSPLMKSLPWLKNQQNSVSPNRKVYRTNCVLIKSFIDLLDEKGVQHRFVNKQTNILLQILEDGRLTDNTGRVVSFQNTIVVMTSNAGAHSIATGRAMGFGAQGPRSLKDYEAMKDAVMKEVKDLFRPEFINRVDELIVFHALTEEDILQITEMMLRQVAERLKEREIRLTWDKTVREKLAREGYDPKYGARPLRRLIQRSVEDTLSEALLEGRILLDEPVRLGVRGGEIVIRDQKKAEGGPARLPQGARVK